MGASEFSRTARAAQKLRDMLDAWTHASLGSSPCSLDPNRVIDAYKNDVDRTLLREELRLSTTERVRKMVGALRFAESVRRSRVKAGAR